MQASRVVAWAALFWGCVVYLPVGMNYAGLFLLTGCLLAAPGRAARWRQLRAHGLFWPLAVYLGWTALTLLWQPAWYAETPSNLWHGVRIALTLALALMLAEEEALWAVRGFLGASAVALLVIALHLGAGVPHPPGTRQLIEYMGNKAISNALLMALLSGSCMVLALQGGARGRAWALVGLAACVAVLVWVLPNRTSLLLLLVAVPLAAIHRWRRHRGRLAVALLASLLGAAAFSWGVAPVRERWELGIEEMKPALRGEYTPSSWNQRIQLIVGTVGMIRERPLTGWGIGGWNQKWRERAPAATAETNMPHNDFLWMGSQAGLPGAFAWLAVMLAAVVAGWRRTGLEGRMAFVAAFMAASSALLNSATRDATIGLSLLWVLGLYLRLPDVGLARLLPARRSNPAA